MPILTQQPGLGKPKLVVGDGEFHAAYDCRKSITPEWVPHQRTRARPSTGRIASIVILWSYFQN
jgi:hypothetical protein